ncbi:hypothetical protein Trydic_g4076 [Trypoxylus dichotomus]
MYYDNLTIEIDTSDSNMKFRSCKQLHVRTDSKVLFETSKKVYKMGDTVKFRILAIGFDLKPAKDYKIISLLEVKSPYPAPATVKEWRNVSSDLGSVHLEFQLAPDTPVGFRHIIADNLYGIFEVKKYVLPRFQAKISGPDEECLLYSLRNVFLRKKLQGYALLTAKHAYDYGSPFIQLKNLTEGCAKFEILIKDHGLDRVRIRKIEISATVTEDATAQSESANMIARINMRPYSPLIYFKTQCIKPSLPLQGHPDVCSNFTLDSNNKLEFVIPPVRELLDNDKIEIHAKVIDHPLTYTPIYTLKGWHSKSANAIKILDSKRNPVHCESVLEYVVQPLSLDDYENVVGKEGYNAEGNPIDKFNLKIKLDKKIYTDAKLVIYYDYDGEVISDRINIDVKEYAPNPVNKCFYLTNVYQLIATLTIYDWDMFGMILY